MSDGKQRRTACVWLGDRRIPIVGRIERGGQVILRETVIARRLAGPAERPAGEPPAA